MSSKESSKEAEKPLFETEEELAFWCRLVDEIEAEEAEKEKAREARKVKLEPSGGLEPRELKEEGPGPSSP